ncbi:MAG: M24 family metallopeptidase [Dehalococcoidales bacterium]|jgi:Xaa-Pro aminopeptidase|nr:M24 family metallopeptidase [Dehalococcoidales bacterium]
MAISLNEYRKRYDAIRRLMKDHKMDCLLIVGLPDDFNRGNIRYITGYGRGGYCLFPIEGKPGLFFNAVPKSTSRLSGMIEALELIDLKESVNLIEQIPQELLMIDGGNYIGLIGTSCISAKLYSKLKKQFGQRLIEDDNFLESLREIKSPEEVEQTRIAAAVADRVYQHLRKISRPWLSEGMIYGEVKRTIYEMGCEYSFDLIDTSSSKLQMSFYPTRSNLEPGGTLFMEISPAYCGYYAQLPVTLPVIRYPTHIQQMVKAWFEADQELRSLLKPGTKISELYKKAVSVINYHGFISPLRPGHALGLDILDFWSITANNDKVMKPGMVIAVHPCCVSPISGEGVGLGYTYLITDTGFEKLNNVDLGADLLGI